MGSYTLIVGVLKYFLLWGFCPLWFLSFGSFVLSCFCPFLLFSVRPRDRMTRMLIFHKWSCDHGIVHLDCWSIKAFSLLGVLSALSFILLGLLCYGALVHFGFFRSAHVIAWWECWLSKPVSCNHGIVHLDCWSIKIFSVLAVLSALIFILWIICPMVLLSILAFLCPLTWSHDENVDFPQVHHVIMGSYTLIVGVLKNFLFWGFCPLWVLSFGSFVLWCYSPFWLFSVCPRDRMRRMLNFHTCIMWSWDRTPWLLEY